MAWYFISRIRVLLLVRKLFLLALWIKNVGVTIFKILTRICNLHRNRKKLLFRSRGKKIKLFRSDIIEVYIKKYRWRIDTQK